MALRKLCLLFSYLLAITTAYAGSDTKSVTISVDTTMIMDDYVHYQAPELLPDKPGAAITHFTHTSRAASNLVEIQYRVEDADSPTVAVRGMVMLDNGAAPHVAAFLAPMTSFVEGTAANMGASITPGAAMKNVVWNAEADLGQTTHNIYLRFMAKDEQSPLSLHFVTIPAEGGSPPFKMSRYAGFGHPGMLDGLWLWLLAGGEVRRGTGADIDKVVGVSGSFDAQVLTDGYGANLTDTGKQFLMQYLGVRAATDDEKRRAKEASTPGSVTQWPPAKQAFGRPVKVNEYAIETGAAEDLYLVKQE